ncbi:MAG TPA: KUP/HAK/KT family potassium transporter [Steroidobacteraceae bacterium]|nr:KUP/HAK/KT family potassium transporter [Steroidobacteraceae bacterium]
MSALEPLHEQPVFHRRLVIAAVGVVFGDIGTSPLYAMRACLTAGGTSEVDPVTVYGVLSLIFWALALTISAKYMAIVLRSDNRGEGGVLALTALVSSERPLTAPVLVAILGLAGCALFYGDGSITPAVTVLSAVEGLEVVTPVFRHAVMPLTIVALLILFSLQRRGTGQIGGLFGPVMSLWFVVLGALGVFGIIQHPAVLVAVNPVFAIEFLRTHSATSLLVIGSVFLAVTGGEALYADLGHFGAKPIRYAWFLLVWPALLLNYFGQGGMLLTTPTALDNPFFHLAPSWFLVPLVLLATAAAIIASQAVISGVFSMSHQALQLGLLPRVRIVHSSAEAMGQVYVPSVNWVLCAATIALVLFFRSSNNLANAYGIAVASTMVIETLLLVTLLTGREERADRLLLYCLIPLGTVDVVYFLSNITKIPAGGWYPLIAGAFVFIVMRTWTRGRVIVTDLMHRQGRTVPQFLAQIERDKPARVPGVAVFLTNDTAGIPRTLARNLQHNGVVHEKTILLSVQTQRVPRVGRGVRCTVSEVGKGLWRVVVKVGFMEQPQVPRLLRDAERCGLPVRTHDATFFLARDDIVAGGRRGLATWRKYLFLILARNAEFAGAHFSIPPERIVEIGGQVQI